MIDKSSIQEMVMFCSCCSPPSAPAAVTLTTCVEKPPGHHHTPTSNNKQLFSNQCFKRCVFFLTQDIKCNTMFFESC